MRWISQNWFWLAVALLFVFMHLGHGGHGGHGSPPPPRDGDDRAQDPGPDAPVQRTGHQH